MCRGGRCSRGDAQRGARHLHLFGLGGTPQHQVAFIRFHGLSCRFCLHETPHPGDVDKQPEPEPGSIWAVLLEDLDE